MQRIERTSNFGGAATRFARGCIVVLTLAASGLALGEAPAGFDAGKLRADAEAGDPVKQGLLGFALMLGRGVPQNGTEGLQWLKRGVDQGDAASMAFLGTVYVEGIGVDKNPTEGLKWLRKSAEKGLALAQVALAQYFFQGQAVNRDDKEAVKWARLAADQGNREGQRVLGACYMGGRGVAQDYGKAVEWIGKAAEQGDPVAKKMLPTAIAIRDAEKSPDALAKAVEFLRKNAEAGNARAQYEYSQLYERGDVVPKNDALALEWLRKAAAQDYPEALSALGGRHLRGLGVKMDAAQARALFLAAAERGHAKSQTILGIMVGSGEGGPRDVVEGAKWLNIAVAGGAPDIAGKQKALLEATMNPAQLAEAERRAKDWLKRPPSERLSH